MDKIAQRLIELFIDLTESEMIQIQFSIDRITILVVSDWFHNQTQEQRLDYLAEGIQVSCPDLIQIYKFHFIAYTPLEAKGLHKRPLAS